MRVVTPAGDVIELGATETAPTIGITDYSRRVTDDYGVTTVVERGFARRMSVRLALPSEEVDGIQRRLADLRAKAALWVADDRFASLSVRGFYKDFSLDLPAGSTSYCTLSVEGLAEAATAPDTGIDPAPDGGVSAFQLLQPVSVTDAALAAASIAEDDAPEWAAGTTYPAGARVIRGALHRVFESLAAGNVGNDPAGVGKWLDLGPTNRWAMFDQALGTSSTAADAIVVTIDAAGIDAVALLDVKAATVRVQAAGYDRLQIVGPGAVTFLDLPTDAGAVTVRIAGNGTVAVGTLLVGRRVGLGTTEASPTAGITDYSRKVVDEFGEVTVVERAWAKRMTARTLIRTDALDVVAARIAAVRARPSLWIGQAGLDSLTVYGFFKDFSIEVGENVSKLSLSIEGLSAAAPIRPLTTSVAWPDITDPKGTKPANNATNSADPNSPWGRDQTVGEAKAQLAAVEKTANDLLATYGSTAAAAASAEAAQIAERSATGAANTSGQNANAAARYSVLATRGPSLIQNPNFTLWPDGQHLPTSYQHWAEDGGSAITRIEGRNGYPFATRMVGLDNYSVGIQQIVSKSFGAFVIEVTVSADNITGAGILVQALHGDNSNFNGGSEDRSFSLFNRPDTSGWPSAPDGGAGNYLRTFSFFYQTRVDGGIERYRVHVMGNWDGFGAGFRAKTIDFHSVNMRPATEAEIAQHDPIDGLGAKASITRAQQIAADAAGNALTQSRDDFNSKFSGVVPTGLSNLIGQRPTYNEVTANVRDQVDTAAGPGGAIARRVFETTAQLGGNLIGNSALLTTSGWFITTLSPGSQGGLNIAGDDWRLPRENNIGFSQVGGAAGQYSDWESDLVATDAGSFFQVSVMGASHRADIEAFIHRFDSSGNHYDHQSLGYISRAGFANGGQNPNNWDKMRLNYQATGPSRIILRKYDTNPGHQDSYAWFTRPQIARIPDTSYPAVPYMPGADIATTRITQSSLADAQGKLASYLKIETIAGTSIARASFLSANGKPSQILLDADQIILNGRVIVSDTVGPSALNRGEFVRDGVDTDNVYYQQRSPGAQICGGLNLTVPTFVASGVVKISFTAQVGYPFSLAEYQQPYYNDTALYLRIIGPNGSLHDFKVPQSEPLKSFGEPSGHTLIMEMPVDWPSAGQVQIYTYLQRGGTDQPGTPPSAGPPGEPPNPPIYGNKSVDIVVTNQSLYAKWLALS